MSTDERRMKVLKYWEKKKQRINRNHVRYHCRQDLAQNRFRYQGRFISKEQMQKIMELEGGQDEIYDPKMKCTPKTKQIFKVEKFSRSTSISSGKGTLKPREASQEENAGSINSDQDMQYQPNSAPTGGLLSGLELKQKFSAMEREIGSSNL